METEPLLSEGQRHGNEKSQNHPRISGSSEWLEPKAILNTWGIWMSMGDGDRGYDSLRN